MALVRKSIDYPKSRGVKDEQTAFGIQTKSRTQPRVIDVVGIKPGLRIAIACGKTPRAYLDMLSPYFDEVLHLPFNKGKPYY